MIQTAFSRMTPRQQEMETSQLAGFITSSIGPDGWARGYHIGNRHVWRLGNMSWRSAEVVEGKYSNHLSHETQQQALDRWPR